MGKVIAFVYGAVAYVVFFVSFLYAIGFIGNLIVPKGIDDGPVGPIGAALLINVLLLGLFESYRERRRPNSLNQATSAC